MESGGVRASDTEDIKRMVKPFPEERTEIREVDNTVKLKIAIDIQWLKHSVMAHPWQTRGLGLSAGLYSLLFLSLSSVQVPQGSVILLMALLCNLMCAQNWQKVK